MTKTHYFLSNIFYLIVSEIAVFRDPCTGSELNGLAFVGTFVKTHRPVEVPNSRENNVTPRHRPPPNAEAEVTPLPPKQSE